MKPKSLNRQYECDDGVFNVDWEEDGRAPISCEWKLTPCSKAGKYWCVECGLVICLGHRRDHSQKKQHSDRIAMWKEKGVRVTTDGRVFDD